MPRDAANPWPLPLWPVRCPTAKRPHQSRTCVCVSDSFFLGNVSIPKRASIAQSSGPPVELFYFSFVLAVVFFCNFLFCYFLVRMRVHCCTKCVRGCFAVCVCVCVCVRVSSPVCDHRVEIIKTLTRLFHIRRLITATTMAAVHCGNSPFGGYQVLLFFFVVVVVVVQFFITCFLCLSS